MARLKGSDLLGEKKGYFQQSSVLAPNDTTKAVTSGNAQVTALLSRQNQILSSTKDTLGIIALILKKNTGKKDKGFLADLEKAISNSMSSLSGGLIPFGSDGSGKRKTKPKGKPSKVAQLYKKYVPQKAQNVFGKVGRAASKVGRGIGVVGSALGSAAVLGGRVAMVGAGAYGMYDSFNEIQKKKNESFLGMGADEGGLLNSRGANYLKSAGSGALAGAAIGGPVGAAVGGIIGAGTALYADYQEEINQSISDMYDSVASFFTDTIPEYFSKGVDAVKGAFQKTIQSYSDAFSSVKDSILGIPTALSEAFGKVVDWVKEFIFGGSKLDMLSDLAKSVKEFVLGLLPKIGDAIYKMLGLDSFVRTKDAIGNVYEKAKEWWDSDSNTKNTKGVNLQPSSVGKHLDFSSQEGIINQVMHDLEGGSALVQDTYGEARFGISPHANPGVNPRTLTEKGAMDIYKKSYWKQSGADKTDDPAMQLALVNAGINAGQGTARQLFKESGEDPTKFNVLLREHYRNLAEKNPKKHGPNLQGWLNRTDNVDERIKLLRKETAQAESKPIKPIKHIVEEKQNQPTVQQQPTVVNIGGGGSSGPNPVQTVSNMQFAVDDMGLNYLNTMSFN